jgi:MYXO-CTERM domain-containing protein
MTDLGTFGGNSGEAMGVNDSGDVVGWATIPNGNLHAFVSLGGVMYDLNSLINDPTWLLAMATDINERGDIVGWGSKNGQRRAFLLTVPEPGAGAVALAALAGAALKRRRKYR